MDRNFANNKAKSGAECVQKIQEKLPIFIISHNRLTALKNCIASLQKHFGDTVDICIHDNCSTYEPLLEFLRRCDHKVFWNDGNELNDVALSVESYFKNTKSQAQHYAVTDPDIEFLDETPPDTLELYCALLDRHSTETFTAAGPELRIDDIPDHYPLKQELLQRHKVGHANDIMQTFQWHDGKQVSVCQRPVDTTFAVYRRSFVFRRLNTALLCHGNYMARHIDWYIDPNNMAEDDWLYMQRDNKWGHWGSTWLKPHVLNKDKKM